MLHSANLISFFLFVVLNENSLVKEMRLQLIGKKKGKENLQMNGQSTTKRPSAIRKNSHSLKK